MAGLIHRSRHNGQHADYDAKLRGTIFPAKLRIYRDTMSGHITLRGRSIRRTSLEHFRNNNRGFRTADIFRTLETFIARRHTKMRTEKLSIPRAGASVALKEFKKRTKAKLNIPSRAYLIRAL